MKKFIAFIVFVAFVALANTLSAQTAQPEKPESPPGKALFNWIAKILKSNLDISVGATQEYDDNIFLEETDRHRDLKTTLTPSVYLEKQWDKAYIGMGHQAEAVYYRDNVAWVITQETDAELRYEVSPVWAVGVKDTHIHSGQKWVPDKTGTDRILRLGYNINTLLAQNKLKVADNLTLTNEYQFDYINFLDQNQDTYIDRNIDEARTILGYAVTPQTSLSLGHAFRWVGYHSAEADPKDFTANKLSVGIVQKFLRKFTVDAGIEEEWRNFNEGENSFGLNVKAGLSSTFSKFTSFALRYMRNLGDSSRSEYRQYTSDRVMASMRRYLDPKTILFLSAGYEKQFYDNLDRLATSTIQSGDRRTFLYSGNLTLRRIFTNWLSGELSYHYSKRDTAFPKEGYTNNRYVAGLRVSW